MGNYYAEFDTTPANVVADLKTRMLNSSDWSNISGGTGNVMSATTSHGAQFAIDLADAAATARQIQVGIYRTYASSTGTDKLTRYLCWHWAGGATSDPIHVMLSLGQDHLFIAIEGPRVGEVNTDHSTYGSTRQCLFLGDIVPYFAGEPSGIVASLANQLSLSNQSSSLVYVSRNRANTASWVPAKLATLALPNSNANNDWLAAQRFASGDGNSYLWPYVVIEDTAGLRGRIGKAFFAGISAPGFTSGAGITEFPPSIYQRLVYNSENYILVAPHKGTNVWPSWSGFGYTANSSTLNAYSPVVAVPTA